MKILILCPNNKLGGAEKSAVTQQKALSSLGYEVQLIYLYNGHKSYDETGSSNLGYPIDRKLQVFFALFCRLRREKPDLVLTHLSAVFFAGLISPILRLDVKHFVHTDPLQEFSGLKRYLLKVIIVYNRRLKLYSLNETYKLSLTKLFGVQSFLFKNVIPMKHIEVVEYTDRVSIIARADPVKRLEYVEKLAGLCPNVKFSVVTAAVIGQEKYYQDLIQKLQSFANIELLDGTADISQIFKWCRGAKFCLSLSKYEGLPTNMIESSANGSVPLGLKAPGVTEFLESIAGVETKLLFDRIEDLAIFLTKECALPQIEFKERYTKVLEKVKNNFGEKASIQKLLEIIEDD